MGSCAAPSAKGDDKFITTDYLQQCHVKWVYATAAKSASYLELKEKEDLYSSKFKSLCDNSWDFNTF
ncbi:hypothetical protein ACV8S1_29020, partial [Citrobacter braakii]